MTGDLNGLVVFPNPSRRKTCANDTLPATEQVANLLRGKEDTCVDQR